MEGHSSSTSGQGTNENDMKQRSNRHLAISAATLLACALAFSCGGGGGGGGNGTIIPPDLSAVFTGNSPGGDVGMAAGPSSGGDFDVQIMVNDIDKLYGVASHVYFEHDSASLVGWSGANSILGANAYYNAELAEAGRVFVTATLTDQGIAGIDNATGLLITLHFQATAETDENRFTFGTDVPPDPSRQVTICPTAGQPCSDVTPPPSWTGGTLVVTN